MQLIFIFFRTLSFLFCAIAPLSIPMSESQASGPKASVAIQETEEFGWALVTWLKSKIETYDTLFDNLELQANGIADKQFVSNQKRKWRNTQYLPPMIKRIADNNIEVTFPNFKAVIKVEGLTPIWPRDQC